MPVIEIEWFQGPPTGAFAKGAISLFREEVAPGELRIKRFPLPSAEVRFAVRAFNGNASSVAQEALASFKPAPVPSPPTDLQVTNTVAGVELRWTNPPGAEPWPSPPTSPTPTPSPTPNLAALTTTDVSADASPTSTPTPTPTPAPTPTPTPTPSTVSPPQPAPGTASVSLPGAASTAAKPTTTPTPTPSPTPPTGIRIFRTDGAPRLAGEPVRASTWLDPLPKPGEKPCYALRYTASFKPMVESAQTEPVCVEVKDLVPPEPPARLVGDIGTTFVELSWTASPSTDVAFYRIYRSLDNSPRSLAIETQGPVLRMRDPNMMRGPRAYDVVAVDQGGNESGPSPVLKLIVP